MFLVQPEVSELLVSEAMVSDQGAPQQSSGEAASCSVLPAVGDGRLHGPGTGTRSSWPPWLRRPTPLLPTPPARGASSAGGGDNKAAAAAAATAAVSVEAAAALTLVRPRRLREQNFQQHCLSLSRISTNQENLKHLS